MAIVVIVGAWANQVRAGLHVWKFTLKVWIQLKYILILGSSDVY